MADMLNVHGKQTVADLQMSFAGADGLPQSVDAGDEPKDGLKLDLDFRPEADDASGGGPRMAHNGYRTTPKIFSQVVASRGERAADGEREKDDEGEGENEDPRTRRRRRGDALGRRYVTNTSSHGYRLGG